MVTRIRSIVFAALVFAGMAFATAEALSPPASAAQQVTGCCVGLGSCGPGLLCDESIPTTGCGAQNPPFRGKCRAPDPSKPVEPIYVPLPYPG